MSTPLPSASSAVELSTRPFEDLLERSGDVAWSDGRPHLVGTVCTTCGAKNFPRRMACLVCGGVELAETSMATEGTLYSHTTVHVSGSRETPYHLAYLDLADGVRILAAVSDEAITAGIDRPVELEATAAGEWRFVPATGAAR